MAGRQITHRQPKPEERTDFYIKAVLAALLCPFGFKLKDIDTKVSERSKRRFILELEKAGWLNRIGIRTLGKWTSSRKLTEVATKNLIQNPIIILQLCENALRLHPSNSIKSDLLRQMLLDLRRGSMSAAERPLGKGET